MSTLTALTTVEEYRQLPDDPGVVLELQHGEVVRLAPPKLRHHLIQRVLVRLLERRLSAYGEVTMEFAYRALPEFELRAADVAVVSHARWSQMDLDDNLHGSPDLVVEVLSPSNTQRQMRELASLCLATGSSEFWMVDGKHQSVTVFTRDGASKRFVPGESIPLANFSSNEGLDPGQLFAG